MVRTPLAGGVTGRHQVQGVEADISVTSPSGVEPNRRLHESQPHTHTLAWGGYVTNTHPHTTSHAEKSPVPYSPSFSVASGLSNTAHARARCLNLRVGRLFSLTSAMGDQDVGFIAEVLTVLLSALDVMMKAVIAMEEEEAAVNERKRVKSLPRPYMKREKVERESVQLSLWYRKYIVGGSQYDFPRTHKDHFRNLFRMPRVLFFQFVEMARTSNWFPKVGKPDCTGKVGAPLELLMLCPLAFIGGCMSVQAISDATNLGDRTVRDFIKLFVQVGSTSLAALYVKWPQTVEEAKRVLASYEHGGLPGCVGSMDGTDVPLLSPKESIKVLTIGKGGYPTVSFNVVSTPSTRICSVTDAYVGGMNDKSKVKMHDEVLNLHQGLTFRGLVWQMRAEHGIVIERRGAYVICDGGYLRWNCTMFPVKYDAQLAEWSCWLESVRKDVERTFGILKQRFRMLKHGLAVQSLEGSAEIFKTCCALHNMILDYNERNTDDEDMVFNEANGFVPTTARDDALAAIDSIPMFTTGDCTKHEYADRCLLFATHFKIVKGERPGGKMDLPCSRVKCEVREFTDADDEEVAQWLAQEQHAQAEQEVNQYPLSAAQSSSVGATSSATDE
jgi:hypothetical protein